MNLPRAFRREAERQSGNANSRKWAGRTLFWPVFMLFVVLSPFSALRGPLTAFRPRSSDFGPRPSPPAPLRAFSAPKTPSAVVFSRKTPRASPLLRDRHYVAPPNRRKADLALVAVPPARTLFPDRAARCAIDPPPHFRYSLATQEKSPRHVKPT